MPVKMMQFAAIVLMVLLTIKLLILPQRAISSSRVNRSRWMLVTGTTLLAIQFILQYVLGLRAQSVTLAVMVNLMFFIPCSALFSLAMLNLQRHGFLSRTEKYIFILVWITVITMIVVGVKTKDMPLFSNMSNLVLAENIASLLYAGMQLFYTVHQIRYLRMIRRAVANYYDRDMNDLLQWMYWSIVIMTMMAIMVPIIIFGHGLLLTISAGVLFLFMFYLIDCFCLYTVSNAPASVVEAQQSEEEAQNEEQKSQEQKSEEHISDSSLQRAEQAVTRWIENRGHLKAGLNQPTAADEIGVPRYLLTAWLKQKGTRYSDWLAELRIDEAKQVLRQHPEWSNETIAQHCGFSDRTYFQRKFKEITGLTPNDYLSKL
jgi:AraC-type DNA-binding domain-containing proteins